jgi:hypothetical protein
MVVFWWDEGQKVSLSSTYNDKDWEDCGIFLVEAAKRHRLQTLLLYYYSITRDNTKYNQ